MIVLGMRSDKYAHRFIPMDKSYFYYLEDRSDAYTVIEINIMQSRGTETLKTLIKALFIEIEKQPNIKPNRCWHQHPLKT